MHTARRQAGVTLVELMIVVVIIGVLAAIAYPSYQNSVRKGHRASAQAYMMDISQKQQQNFLDARSYVAADDISEIQSGLNIGAPRDVVDFYTVKVELEDGPPPGFTITATPKAGTTQAEDGALTLDNVGRKTPADKW